MLIIKNPLFPIFLSFLFLSNFSLETPHMSNMGIEDAQNKVNEAFELVVEASNYGGKVEHLISELNEALILISKAKDAELAQGENITRIAYEIAEFVKNEALQIKDENLRQHLFENNTLILYICCLILGGLIVYFIGPKIYSYFFLWFKKNHFNNTNKKSLVKNSFLIDVEVWSVIIALILLVSIFTYSEFYFSRNVVEPFSEFGILGYDLKIGNYPTDVVLGNKIYLNIYISNYIGKPTYYVVMIKLRDKEATFDPSPGSPDITLDIILSYKEQRFIPFNITLNRLGLNQRLIFELWKYNVTTHKLEYHNRSCWIWINVTER